MTDKRTPRTVAAGGAGLPEEPSELVERLIRLADSGPEIPADGADRVRAAVQPLWRAEVSARARRRSLAWAGSGLAAAACLVVALTVALRPTTQPSAPSQTVGTIVALVGGLELLPPHGNPLQLAPRDLGLDLEAGSWLRTNDSTRAAVCLTGGQSLRLDLGTRVRLASTRAVDLDRGAVYLESDGGEPSGLEVRTGLGVARDTGTQFEVRVTGESLSVRVREGSVALTRDGDELVIRHGLAVTVAPDGSRRTFAVPSYDPSWAWVQEVAPPFQIEGRSVVAFLDWVSSETGLWVTFSGPEVERFASTTVLHGTIEGLGPAQAPEVVLPGCGLELSRRPGTLVVGWPGSSADVR